MIPNMIASASDDGTVRLWAPLASASCQTMKTSDEPHSTSEFAMALSSVVYSFLFVCKTNIVKGPFVSYF